MPHAYVAYQVRRNNPGPTIETMKFIGDGYQGGRDYWYLYVHKE